MHSDTLLYDFNLKIGDTLPRTYLQNDLIGGVGIVKKIDSVLIGSQYNKKYIFGNPTGPQGGNTLIEGVGSGGALDLIYDFFEGGPVTACFNANIISPEAIYSECSINAFAVSVTDDFTVNNVQIFPNPFFLETVLHTDQFFKDATMTVYNSFGQTVKQINYLSGQAIIFHRENLPSGLYFIRLTEENKTIAVDKLAIADK